MTPLKFVRWCLKWRWSDNNALCDLVMNFLMRCTVSMSIISGHVTCAPANCFSIAFRFNFFYHSIDREILCHPVIVTIDWALHGWVLGSKWFSCLLRYRVSYLLGSLWSFLRVTKEHLDIRDVLCVQIAGLCHDLTIMSHNTIIRGHSLKLLRDLVLLIGR